MKKIILIFLLVFVTQSYAQKISGLADLHVHMFSNKGFAGAWFVGDPNMDKYEQMFSYCKEGEKWPWLKGVFNKIDPYISSFLFRNHCVPKEEAFPMWNDLAHQQVWKNDLKKARAQGYKLMIMSAVHSYLLCRILPDSRKDFDTCEDKPNLLRQLKDAKKFVDSVDWAELALTPEDTRRIINEGKLAVIFSIESSNGFEQKDWKKEFKDYWDHGVRTMQIVHQFDNTLAGAAIHKPPLKLGHYIRNWMRYSKFQGFDSEEVEYKTPYGTRTVVQNKKGLTKKGKEVIQHMMDMGMMIDFAHMSTRTQEDVLKVIEPKKYPFYYSHGHFRDAMRDGLGRFEKSTSKEMLLKMKQLDGVFGIRTITFGTHQVDKNIQNNCDGSSLSVAHLIKWGNDLEINMAFGSDFNGFIPQTRPRFSKTDKDYCKGQKVKGLGKKFDYTGLGNVNQIPDLLQDLKNLGADTSSLEESAEKIINVWEKSYAQKASEVLL
jgi:microsomal dipeptidase-like Zn-dependent dipeptidase